MQCDLTSLTSRKEQVSDEEDVQEIEQSASDDEEQDHCVLHGIGEGHDNSVDNVVRIVLPQWKNCKNISACIYCTGEGANTVCLVVDHERQRNCSSAFRPCCSHDGSGGRMGGTASCS